MKQQKMKRRSSLRRYFSILKTNKSGDLRELKSIESLKHSHLAFMVGSGLLVSTCLAVPTFASYFDQLNQQTTESVLLAEDERSNSAQDLLGGEFESSLNETDALVEEVSEEETILEEEAVATTWWSWGLLILVLVGGVATFQSLRKMEAVEESEEYFIGDDLDDEDDEEWLEAPGETPSEESTPVEASDSEAEK